jgi:mannose-1-phosphate guanylyltransferase
LTRAMILAAGLGTRLGTLSDERPKPMLPVVDVPLIRYAVALLRGHGVREIVVNLHHRGDLIETNLGDGARLGVDIVYSREEHILGTGGGIRRALPYLGDEPFLVINGKLVIDLDLEEVLARHRAAGAAATLVVRRDPDARRWGAIDAPLEGGPLRGLLGEGELMFTGVQVLDPELVRKLPDDDAPHCIVREGYVPWLAEGAPIHAHVMDGYFMEHSTPERYLEGNINVLRGRAALRYPPGPLVGVDPAADVHAEAELVPPVRIGAGARVGAYAIVGPDVVVGAHATVVAGVRVARSVLWPGTSLAEDSDGVIATRTQRVRLKASSPRDA